MIRVRLETSYAGPRGSFPPGTEIDCGDDEAKALIGGRFAVAVAPLPAPVAPIDDDDDDDAEAIPMVPVRRRGRPPGRR